MPGQNSAISIIPYECFRWQPRVQFMETFKTRTAALNFAYQQGYNLIVERNEGRTALFDVLDDPEGVCTSGLELELLKTEDVLVDRTPKGWTALMLWTMWDLAKRLGALAAVLCARQIVPLSRRAAAVAGLYLRQIVPLSRRAAAVAGVYLRKIIPLSRRAAAVAGVYLQEIVPLSRRAAATAAVYLREIAPLSRRAASRFWWSNTAVAFRRAWHRHSHGSVSDQARRLAAEISCLHVREIAPRVRHAASRFRWSVIQGDLRHSWSSSLSTGSDHRGRFAAAAVNLYHQEIVPLSRRAAIVARAYLRAIAAISRRTAAFANLYFREIAPILRDVAARCWSDSKNMSRRQSWAVAAPNQPNSSQLR